MKLNLVGWLQKEIEQDSARRLRCRCNLHVYKWNWRKLAKVCVYCGKVKK